MTTNITDQLHRDFDALASGQYTNFALFSCFINGEPGAAIVAVKQEESGDYIIKPLFVSVTEGMEITDHDGVKANA